MNRAFPEPERSTHLVFDWNDVKRGRRGALPEVSFFDETLRDGLQNPSATDPSIEDKLKLLHAMNELGIHEADIGLPASSRRNFADCLRLCKEVAGQRLKIRIACAGRTTVNDVTPIIELSQRAGIPIEVYAFIGSSPIRQYAEGWDLAEVVARSIDAIDVAVRAGLQVAYVTEDTTRSRPDALTTLFRAAIEHGATRICLADTVGHATLEGVRNLVAFTRDLLTGLGAQHVGIDWHGHNDRGLALANALWALDCGVDRIHATALGIGERVGNVPMELLLMNMKLLGLIDHDLRNLVEYTETAARAIGWDIPINYPLVGRDAFRTATGVHAAAIVKAMDKGDTAVADCIYSGVPAGTFGRTQEICIGFMSGASNVRYWLEKRGITESDALVTEILSAAKARDRIMTDDEVRQVVARVQAR